MSVYPIQATFSRGEISPLLHSRVELDHYRLGLEECLNWTVLPQGGLRRRSGSRFISKARYHDRSTRLIPFIFSSQQAYMLEFGDHYIRVYANGGVVESAPGVPVEIVTPFEASDVFGLHYTQSADVLYLAHRGFPPQKLERTAHTAWSLSEIEFKDGPYLAINEGPTSLTPSATAGSLTLTASSTTGLNGNQGFIVSDVGRLVRYQASDGHWHSFRITSFLSSTTVAADYVAGYDADADPPAELTALPNTNARSQWQLGAWSNATGFPARVAFFEERLAFARTDHQPQTVWMSVSGDFQTHRPGALPDDAIELTILAGQVNEIQWIAEARSLQIGTTGATRTVSSASADKALAPDNLKQIRHTTYGAEAIQPVQIGSVTLYVGSYGRVLREFVYSLETDSFIAPDLSILSEHLFRNGISQIAFAQTPDSIAWLSSGTGELIGLTYERDQKVVGFHRHRLAGGFADEFGAVESVATMPGNAGRDETWLVVRRTIGGSVARYVERLEAPFENQDKADAFFVDSGLTYTGSPVGTVTGLSHLEGETVAILADGAVDPPQTVIGGAVTLQGGRTASKIHVGLPYTSRVRTLAAAIEGRDGSLVGRRRRVWRVVVGLMETLGIRIGTGEDAAEDVIARRAVDPMDQSPALFSGNISVGVDSKWSDASNIVILAEAPLPATILSLTPATKTEP